MLRSQNLTVLNVKMFGQSIHARLSPEMQNNPEHPEEIFSSAIGKVRKFDRFKHKFTHGYLLNCQIFMILFKLTKLFCFVWKHLSFKFCSKIKSRLFNNLFILLNLFFHNCCAILFSFCLCKFWTSLFFFFNIHLKPWLYNLPWFSSWLKSASC